MGRQWKVTDFIFLGSKTTADGDRSHEIKRRLLLGRKAMTNLDSMLKSWDISLLTKVCLVKAMVVPVVTYGCESWTIKKAERQRIDAFELWGWRRFLRVPWTARRPNQSILKEISPEYSLEELMLKLKLPYFGHLMQRTDSLEKTLILGKIEAGGEGGDREWDGWTASMTQWTWVWANWEMQKDREAWCAASYKESDMTEEMNWTESSSRQIFIPPPHKGGKGDFIEERHHPAQVVSYHHQRWDKWLLRWHPDKDTTSLLGHSCQKFMRESNHKETSDKPRLRATQQNNRSSLIKNATLFKD